MKRGRKISYVCRINRNGIGEVSTKYGYDRDGKQFETDIQRSIEHTEKIYNEFTVWVQSKNITTNMFLNLFRCYYAEFIQESCVQCKTKAAKKLYAEFIKWIKDNNFNPHLFRRLFLRYYEKFIKIDKDV